MYCSYKNKDKGFWITCYLKKEKSSFKIFQKKIWQQFHIADVSHCGCFTLQMFHIVAVSHCRCFTLWLFHIADAEKMAHYAEDEKHIREENLRLQRKLQMEIERREALCRHLSESESSLEMDDERWVLVGSLSKWFLLTKGLAQCHRGCWSHVTHVKV